MWFIGVLTYHKEYICRIFPGQVRCCARGKRESLISLLSSAQGVKVTLVETGVGIPQPGRSRAAILIENESPLLLDCGAGTLLRLEQAGVRPVQLDTAVLTHLHLDHVSDLAALANAPPLRAAGPRDLGARGHKGIRQNRAQRLPEPWSCGDHQGHPGQESGLLCLRWL